MNISMSGLAKKALIGVLNAGFDTSHKTDYSGDLGLARRLNQHNGISV